MSLLNYFRSSRKNTASIAKERLQIIVAHERSQRSGPDYLPLLQQDLLQVVRKYVNVGQEDVKVHVQHDGNCEVLELNVTLPDSLT